MKKISLMALVVAGAMLLTNCKKEEKGNSTNNGGSSITVTQQQNALVVEPTATWCGPCGTYGKPVTDDVLASNPKAIGIYAHLKAPASDIGSQTGQDLAVMYGAANATGTSYSIPKIAVGNNVTGAYTDLNYTKGIINGHINTITAQTSKANTKIEASISGTTLNVKAHTKFFEAGEAGSTYKISLILVEDKISNRQNHNGTGYTVVEHHNVARATITAATSGDNLLATGVPANGELITKEYSSTLNSNWNKDNLTVIAIIWKQVGTNLTFINVDKLDL